MPDDVELASEVPILMRHIRRVWSISILLVWASAGCWAAETRLLVLRDDSSLVRTAADLLAQELIRAGYSPVQINVGEQTVMPGADVGFGVVALGARAHAVALKIAAGRPVIALLVTHATVENLPATVGDRGTAIVLDQPVHRWSNLLQLAFPGQSQVGLLVGPKGNRMLGALERGLNERRIALATEVVTSAEGVVPALERLIPRMGLLLALPDPVAHNRNTVQALLLTTYRAGIPVVAYSEAYQQAGAVLVLYSTLSQIVAQVMDTLRQYREGKHVPNIQAPRYFTVGINSVVARSLGLHLPSADDLQERLKALDQ